MTLTLKKIRKRIRGSYGIRGISAVWSDFVRSVTSGQRAQFVGGALTQIFI
jgi:hypothetical protein